MSVSFGGVVYVNDPVAAGAPVTALDGPKLRGDGGDCPGAGTEPLGERARSASGRGLVELDRLETDEPARWEKHIHSLLEPRRLRGTRECFRVTSEQLAEAVSATRAWAADDLAKELRVAELAARRSDGRLLEPDSRAFELCEELRRLKAHEYTVKVRRLRVENELRLLVGTADGISGVASWKTRSQRHFQQARFKAARADLFERFVEPVFYRPFRLV